MISVEFQDGNKYEEEHNSEVIHQKGVSVNDKEKVKTDLAEWTEKGNSISCACDKEKTKELQFSIEAIKQGEVKVENQGNPIEIDVRPSPVNMVKIDCEKETSKVTLIGFEQTVKNMGVVNYKDTKAAQGTIFQIIYCPMSNSQEYQLLGVEFPWEPGGQKHKIITQKYKPPRIYFPWPTGDQKPKITTHKYRLFEDQFPWDPGRC
jgi:hypothetical protein